MLTRQPPQAVVHAPKKYTRTRKVLQEMTIQRNLARGVMILLIGLGRKQKSTIHHMSYYSVT